MTIQYKNQGFALAGGTLTTVLTIATTAAAIVKSVSITNTSSGSVVATCKLRDSSAGADFTFFQKSMATKTTEQAANQVLNLEGGDGIKAQGTAQVEGVISYALIDRSQENG